LSVEIEEGSAVSNDAYSRAGRQTSGAAVGFILFAAIMMIMVGVFQGLQGLVGIFENEFYVPTRNYIFQFDATTWGWIHLLIGLVVAFAGWGLLSGRTWARTVAIFLAVLSALANFLFIPLLPVLVVAHHHPGRLCDLGRGRPWWGPARAGLSRGVTHSG
jgi:hypothetical protein